MDGFAPDNAMTTKRYTHIAYWPYAPTESAYTDRTWDTSRRPWIHPQYLNFYNAHIDSYGDDRPPGLFWPPGIFDNLPPFGDYVDVLNKVYGKFTAACGDQSQWANNMLEAKENIETISSHAASIASCFRNLKRGNVSAAAKALGVTLPNGKRRAVKNAKSAADAFLEMHFGWVPLAEDMRNSMNHLTKDDFGSKSISQTAHSSTKWHDANWNNDPSMYRYGFQEGVQTCTIHQKAKVRISNPNSYLANQLGVTNPLAVAWEAVPYSFVVDWFSNVGQCLSAMTDMMGLQLEDAYTTYTRRATLSRFTSVDNPHYPDWWWHNTVSSNSTALSVVRSPGIAGPQLALKPFKGFSPLRGATAISLLVQTLKS